MPLSNNGPSFSGSAPFECEEGTVVDVNHNNFTVIVASTYSARTYPDLPVMSPYMHSANGEGLYFMPEVGAKCWVAKPSDTSPPFVLGFSMPPSVRTSENGDPIRSNTTGGSTSDVTYQGRRLSILPGDMVLATRDENFIILRRGGILQIGSTDIAQRIYFPIGNYIKDFCENYSMEAFGGDIRWNVERQENDPSGNAPCSYLFHMNEFAQDAKASMRVRHYPLSGPSGDPKRVWEVTVAPQGIDRNTGETTNVKYTLVVSMDGKKVEMIGADRSVTVSGNDLLEVSGNMTHKADGNALWQGGQEARVKAPRVFVEGNQVFVGGDDASEPVPLGNALLLWLSTHTHLSSAPGAPTGTAVPPPLSATLLSSKVKVSR